MSRVGTGRRAEEIARQYLIEKGFVPLAQNYRVGAKELDLVMRDGDTTVFVEVKARSSFSHGHPSEAIDARKRRNLSIAAAAYLIEHDQYDTPARFDVVELELTRRLIRHIPNAFMADL